MTAQDDFERIADEAIRAAEKVQCSFEDFIQGLDTIRDMVTDRLHLARDEQGGDQHGGRD
jgi:hypothetical protein